MREIKFKYIFHHKKDGDYQSEVYTLDQIQNSEATYPIRLWKLDGYELVDRLEYIGIEDKESKEIYDKHICKMVILEGQEKVNPLQSLLVIIEFKNCCWGFRHLFPELIHEDDREWKSFWKTDDIELWNKKYFTVIGNIYSNPELLTKE